MLFECEKKWVEDKFSRIFYGFEKLRLSGLPLSGKSHLVSVLHGYLREATGGDGLVCIDGRAFSEINQEEMLEAIKSSIEFSVEEHGCCFFIFDHFSHAMMRSKAAKLQSLLFGLLINSSFSAYIGCILVHRNSQLNHLSIATSPLMSRLTRIEIPLVDDGELSELGDGFSEAGQHVGRCPSFIRSAMVVEEGRFSSLSWEGFWQSSRAVVARDIPEDLGRALRGDAGDFSTVARSTREVITPLLDTEGRYLAPGVLDGFSDEFDSRRDAWPINIVSSANRFATILDRIGAAFWYDRYLLDADVTSPLVRFVYEVRKRSTAPIRMLSGCLDDWNLTAVQASMSQLSAIDDVEVRVVTKEHARRMHDRHLVSVATGAGYAVPQVREIVAVNRSGSSVEARLERSPVDYPAVWRGGSASVARR